jgi:hypothetical protein
VNLGAGGASRDQALRWCRAQVGDDLSLVLPPGEWRQSNDVFVASGAGDQDIAFAVVEVTSGEAVGLCLAGRQPRSDPTTIAVLRR